MSTTPRVSLAEFVHNVQRSNATRVAITEDMRDRLIEALTYQDEIELRSVDDELIIVRVVSQED